MANALRNVGTRATPQRERADASQIKNAAGGYVFTIAPEAQFHRFLTLGVTGPTYHVGERKLANEALALVKSYVESAGVKAVNEIVAVSLAGRAPKQDPALFALALASVHGDDKTRSAAYAALSQVARTGSALFSFAQYRTQFNDGFSRGYRSALSSWYLGKPVDKMAYQMVKYRQRDGWDHRRLLQTAHPNPLGDNRREIMFRWALGKPLMEGLESGFPGDTPAILQDFMQAQAVERDTIATSASASARWVEIINRGNGLSWEMLPTQALTRPEVWVALIDQGLPIGALLRQLPRLTNLGLARGNTGNAIRKRLTDPELLKRGRIHPMNVLVQMKTYASGQGRGQSWTPEAGIIDALDATYYAAYGAVRPSGKRLCLALDVSGSMGMRGIDSMAGLTPRECSAALALVQMSVEQDYECVGFRGNGSLHRASAALEKLTLSPRQRLDDAVRYMSNLSFGATDCSLPMLWALEQKREFDSFIIYTDNETWSGRMHPYQALDAYRQKTGIDAKLIVVAMTPPFRQSIARPGDPGMLDIAGMDTAVPNLITDFAAGDIG